MAKYYDVENLIKKVPDAYYYVIFGLRSNGKTYANLKRGIKKRLEDGSDMAYIRRYKEDLKGKNGANIFSALVKNGEIQKLSKGKWNGIYYYSQRWYFTWTNPENPKDKIVDENPFCYGFALTDMEHDKSTSYPSIKTIIFDEFITRSMYLPNEFVTFQNVLSTIIRQRDDVKIFMLGNTINQYCPYFKEMGLTKVMKMDVGTIDVYEYGTSGLKVAVEYSSGNKNGKPSDVYFAFNNPKLKMITSGAWEIAVYPHLPVKYAPKDVIYHYFIIFEESTLMCEIIKVDDNCFTFIHPKTTPIKDGDDSIVYHPIANPKPNYRRRITKPMTKVDEKIAWFFKHEKVFYANNETGEVVRNYLNWCKVATMED